MKFLLDTHALIWFLNNSASLSAAARAAIEAADNHVSVSIVSLWEIAIKVKLGKLNLPAPFEQLFPEQLVLNEIACVPIEIADLHRVSYLDLHHRDPFDRLIAAQALSHGFTLISRDTHFASYGVTTLW
jgi:PIN domain nuclease of toxin-antitoxin system